MPDPRPLRMLRRSWRRVPTATDAYRDPHPLAVLGRRLALRLRTSAAAVAQRGTLSIVGLGFVAAAVWVAFGLAAGLAAVGVACLVVDWRVPE